MTLHHIHETGLPAASVEIPSASDWDTRRDGPNPADPIDRLLYGLNLPEHIPQSTAEPNADLGVSSALERRLAQWMPYIVAGGTIFIALLAWPK